MSDGFLSRWSRRKAEAKEDPTPEVTAPPPQPTPEQPSPPPELPPVESLGKESDFSAFLQAGVPEDLRRAALSRLWTTDPLFTQPEVFDLHMEDYNAHPLGEVVKTAWKVGKGIVEDLVDSAEPASFPETAENKHSKTNTKNDPTTES